MLFRRMRSHLFILLFCGCLSAVLLFPLRANSIQTITTEAPVAAAEILEAKKPETNPSVLNSDVRKTILENGLTVITKEVHTAPVVSVQVWYRVGSSNEAPGVNGIAHQLEHMLFKGTTNRPIQFGRLFSALGSQSNAFTSYDKTVYFGTVERNKLKALLMLEADRMQNALINEKSLESEKRVVISELQGYENSPNYRLSRAVMHAAFPNRAYGLTVGGTKADVEKFTPEQVRYYYQNYYSPDNATLVIVGDFDADSTLKEVKDIFGKVPKTSKGTEARMSQNSPPLNTTSSQSPIILREPGSASLFKVVYPLIAINHPDVPILDVMDYILTGGRSSRIYQALVESGLASSAGGGTVNLITGGWYELSATAAPGKDLTKIADILQKTIADLRNNGVTAEEIDRAKTQIKASQILQNRDITTQAMQLGNDQTLVGDYNYKDRYLAAVNQVTAADVQRVAKQYLDTKLQTQGFFEPTQLKGQSGLAGASGQTSEQFNLGKPVDPAEVAKYLPFIDSNTNSATQTLPEEFTLANGLKVLLLKDDSTPAVTLTGFIQAGTNFDSNTKAGVASLTAQNLMNGTKTKDALKLAKILENRGADLSFAANREGVGFSGNALTSDLPTVLDVLADVVQNATFPTEDFNLSRQRALTSLKLELDSPNALGKRTFQQAIYPENHPLHTFPTEVSLQSILPEDVIDFYHRHYRPDTMVLTLVGNFDPKQVRSLISQQFGEWKVVGKPLKVRYPGVKIPEKVIQLKAVIPGKAQSVTLMGYQGINRRDPRYYGALVLNQILGGDTLSSRLGTEIRDRQGLTYGIYSVFQAGKYAGPFLISMQTAPEDAQKAITSTLRLLKQVYEEGVTVNEVKAAKRSLSSSYNVSLADPDSLASRVLMNEVYGLRAQELADFTLKIQSVTPEQVNQAAKELLHPNNLIVVTAGPS